MNSQKEDKDARVVDAEVTPQAETASAQAKPALEHVTAASGDIVEAQIAKLRNLFPEVFVEGKIDRPPAGGDTAVPVAVVQSCADPG
jgi:hypothetical protein